MLFSQSDTLTVLSHAPAAQVKALAESVIPQLGDILVLQNRTGLVMLPAVDSAEGTTFQLGEILTAEAHVRLGSDVPFQVEDQSGRICIRTGAQNKFMNELPQADGTSRFELSDTGYADKLAAHERTRTVCAARCGEVCRSSGTRTWRS